MTDSTTTSYGVTAFDGRVFPCGDHRRVISGVAICLGIAAAACALAISATVAVAWIICAALPTARDTHPRVPVGPALALARPYAILAGAMEASGRARGLTGLADAPDMTFASKWADATDSTLPPVPRRPFERASNVPSPPHRWEVPQSQTKPDSANASDVTHVAALIPAAAPASPPPGTPPLRPTFTPDSANAVPLRLLPATDETTRSPARQAAQPVTAATPQKHVMPQQAHDRSLLLPGLDGHTAVYDIAAHTVYLPNGEGLEAHSGLGSNLDDPRFVNLKNRGPTPPNVYDLALREQLFHGVRAIRLRPVGDDNMYGRDGILAHSYMLGPNGQSNGCVSFRDYPTFLRAVLRGEVDRLVVVPKLGTRPSRTAMASSGSTGSVMQRQ